LPINARSCKHLKSLLGEEYEAARLQFKNPHAPSSSKAKAGKEKSASKRRKDDDDGPARKVPKSNPAVDGEQNADYEDAEAEEGEDPDEPPARGKSVPKLLLANKWDLADGIDPTGWWMSEKLDGVRYVIKESLPVSFLKMCDRAFFDGKHMISRLGNPFVPPQWFLNSSYTVIKLLYKHLNYVLQNFQKTSR
jgi:DNA ligase-1